RLGRLGDIGTRRPGSAAADPERGKAIAAARREAQRDEAADVRRSLRRARGLWLRRLDNVLQRLDEAAPVADRVGCRGEFGHGRDPSRSPRRIGRARDLRGAARRLGLRAGGEAAAGPAWRWVSSAISIRISASAAKNAAIALRHWRAWTCASGAATLSPPASARLRSMRWRRSRA